jgi:hypothetical protein
MNMNARTMDSSPLTLIAPSGGVVAGQFYQVGEIRGFVIEKAAEGEPFALETCCRNKDAPKVTSTSWSKGDPLMYDTNAAGFTDVATAYTGPMVAKACADAAALDATCDLVLLEDALSSVTGDITQVTAGTGLTGGGTSGVVTVALSTGSITLLGKADAAVPAADLLSLALGKGGALVGLRMPEDVPESFAAVENLDEFVEALFEQFGQGVSNDKDVTVVIALGASSGSSAADPDLVTAANPSLSAPVPVSGNDQVIASVSIAADGAVTITTAAVETAEATFTVNVKYQDLPEA